jgi:hypothetical protein
MLVATSQLVEGSVSEEKIEKKTCYLDRLSEAEKRFSERAKIQGRNGDEVQRKYHLTLEEKVILQTEAISTGGVVNPLKNRIGAYWGQVESLILLGADEWHSLKKIRDKMQEVLSAIPKKKKRLATGKVIETDAWTDFYGKEGREGASKPKDGMGRIESNFKVLQRLPREGKEENNPYGLKLAQFGMCIDIEYREVSAGVYLPFIRLNTSWPMWSPDDGYPTIRPMYVNPNSKRRGRKRSVTALPLDSARVDAVVVAQATALLENKEDCQETTDGKSLEMNDRVDDFDEQLRAYEAEQARGEGIES